MISHEWSLSIENSKPQATNDNMHVYDKKKSMKNQKWNVYYLLLMNHKHS